MSEQSLEGERSSVEPLQGTISVSGQREGYSMSNQHKIALTITNLGASHTNRRGTKTTATVCCYVNEMSSNSYVT